MTHRSDALNFSTRIVNTMLMNGRIAEDVKSGDIVKQIIAMGEQFAEWMGPDPVRSYGGGAPKVEKPTYDKPCPVCGKEMFDLTASKKNPNGPDARCKDTKWNAATGKFEGCSGLFWPPKDVPTSNDQEYS